MSGRSLGSWEFLQYEKSKTTAPISCFLHTMSRIGTKLLLYGGCDQGGNAQKNLFVFDSKSFQWSTLKLSPDTNIDEDPTLRYGHAAVLVEMHPPKIMIYGGLVYGTSFDFDSEDTMLDMNVDKDIISQVASEDDDAEGENNKALPVGMKRISMQRRRKGQKSNASEEFDDAIYFLTLKGQTWQWSKPIVRSKVGILRPMARSEHAITKIDTNVVMIFGGWTQDGRPHNDLWTLDYQSLEWQEAATSGIQPRPRYRHTCEVIGRRFFVLGGSDNGDDDASKTRSKNVFSGLSVLNLETMCWSHPSIAGPSPFPRSGHASTVVGTNFIAIFGGKYSEEVFYNDLFLINVDTFVSMVIPVMGTPPTPISNATLTCVGNRLFCFGGTDKSGGVYNDLRAIDIKEFIPEKDIHVNQDAASDYLFKVLIIGDAGVGKSSVLTRFVENAFSSETTATIGIDFNSRHIVVDGSVCKLEIWDTAGQERFSTMTASYYRNAQGALLVYDVGRYESFANVKKWLERARLLGGEHIEAILVGNKSDLTSAARQVSHEQGQQLATELGLPFVEASAKQGSCVDMVFTHMAQNIKKSVDRRGLAGIASSSLEKSGSIVVADRDSKKSVSQKCC